MSTYNIGLKPRITRINWMDPLTRGLVFDAPFFEGAGTNTEEDNIPDIFGSLLNSPTWNKRQYGPVLTFTDSTNEVDYTSEAFQNSLTNITVEALVYPTAVNAAADSRIIHKGGGNKYFDIALVTGNLLQFETMWTTTDGVFQTPAVSLNAWHHVVCSYSFSAATNIPVFYIDGFSVTVTPNPQSAGSAPTDTTGLGLGNRPLAAGSQTKAWVGDIAYVRYWNRILSKFEVNQLYQNPWRIYQKPKLWSPLYSSMPIIT